MNPSRYMQPSASVGPSLPTPRCSPEPCPCLPQERRGAARGGALMQSNYHGLGKQFYSFSSSVSFITRAGRRLDAVELGGGAEHPARDAQRRRQPAPIKSLSVTQFLSFITHEDPARDAQRRRQPAPPRLSPPPRHGGGA